jgi:rare lipoprotein A (peptidoglycan hydrolase)
MKRREIVIGLSVLVAIGLSGCAQKVAEVKYDEVNVIAGGEYRSASSQNIQSIPHQRQVFKKATYGKASWYGQKFHGKKTASGELYDMYKKTAAHKTLPFNTMVRVTDMVSNKSTIVRINDRGPFVGSRIIDLSYAGAKAIGLVERGVTDIKMEIVGSSGKVSRKLKLPTSDLACADGKCHIDVGHSSLKRREALVYTPMVESVSITDSYYSSDYSSQTVEAYPPSIIDTHSSRISVQVGAFRHYSGAKLYANRYSMLDSQYKAVIKNSTMDAKPLYRVQIEGFGTEKAARRFISKYQYSLDGAFLVMR